MSNVRPQNNGNAKEINEICSTILPLSMIRYEAIFDFYTQEPKIIHAKLKKDDEYNQFEQIFRMRKWNIKGVSYGISIFSQYREWNNEGEDIPKDLAIRLVEWNMDLDINKIKKCSQEQKKELLNHWPSIQIVNFYVGEECSKELIKVIEDLDSIINESIVFKDVAIPSFDYRDIEIRRLYNWGSINLVWSPTKENKEIEYKVESIEKCIRKVIKETNNEIESILLDYEILPECYKKIAFGEE